MNKYQEMKIRHEKESHAFPIRWAFTDEQFKSGMIELGLDPSETDKVVGVYGGGFMRKTDVDAFKEMLNRHDKEMKEAIANDKTGEGFIYDMFDFELANHEYCITYDLEETLDALGISARDIENNDALKHGLMKAIQHQE